MSVADRSAFDSLSRIPVPPMAKPAKKYDRLVSLDVLRGIDIFLLFIVDCLWGALRWGPLASLMDSSPALQETARLLSHHPWQGFTICDLIMPMFIFMTGITIPFSLARYRKEEGGQWSWTVVWRIVRRVVLLWIFGMMIQGNLLALKPENFKLYSNTLQAIATGYLISCIVYLFIPRWGQWLVFVLLLFGYWGACTWVKFDGYGGGSFEPSTNLAFGIDLTVLGHWRDGASIGEAGEVVFNPDYQYTWLLSSLTFGATALSGLFAGELLRGVWHSVREGGDQDRNLWLQGKVFFLLLVLGGISLALGWGWGSISKVTFGYCPIIKKIWTPSMVLYSSGISLILLSLCYLIYDILKLPLLKTFFVVMGANALTAYVLLHLVPFKEVARWVLYGLEQYTGVYYEAILAYVGIGLLWLLLWSLYRCGHFLRV